MYSTIRWNRIIFYLYIIYILEPYRWRNDRVKPKTIKSVFVASPLSNAVLTRKNKDWLARNQNNVWSRATCLPADCCFSELAL